ncbi:pilus assembly protein [Craterilacuibacter sp.]|uniref:pilus assembly protein n=1 Tax=Craterilacuibacter sp. TaxID=2870909 RepID=UPI003F2B184B
MTQRAARKKYRVGLRYRAVALAAVALFGSGLAGPSVSAPVEIADSPLYVGGFVPCNLALVPSVEYPTIISRANLNAYSSSATYAGYFDSDKCYEYETGTKPEDEHFKPVGWASNRTCSNKWSGHFLNWAATQTIDPFRSALTGGYRVKDIASETWLEKARHDRQSDYADSTSNAAGVTPYGWPGIKIRIQGLGSKMRFTGSGDLGLPSNAAYSAHSNTDAANIYEVYVRVKVCVPGLLEKNCKQYGSNWKPEGLIQQYAGQLRYSIFGYLNDHTTSRDGGVMRAKNKFVGNERLDPLSQAWTDNTAKEWNPVTGVLERNPDGSDASATPGGIQDSGVINYLNKFGQMTTKQHKSIDPVSELYYTALRYFKNQGNVSAYSALSGNNQEKYTLADGFPVITAWDDPVQYWCQSNVVLGIGDVNSHRDKNLPGNTFTTDEPVVPAEVRDDESVNVLTATQKIAQLEGVTINTPFTGRENSAYIAGLAYDAHTVDMRPELGVTDAAVLKRIKGKQTLSTYWVDVREGGKLAGASSNQYWLAAKYGGFKVPADFSPYTVTAPIADSLWHTSGEFLATNYKRADNFFVASDATKMIDSLTKAFSRIAAERTSSSAALTASGNQMVDGVSIFQTSFSSSNWAGELTAYELDTVTLKPKATPLWTAAAKVPAPDARKIYVEKNVVLAEFKSNVSGLDQSLIDYLRGDRSQEQPAGNYRARGGVLGDMVNSTPLYVGKPNPALYRGDTGYASFVSGQNSRTPVVYVGGNDGMLHGFNAQTGVETFAFVPAAVLSSLADYAKPEYTHRYFVDGELTVADAYINKAWKTVLVGSLGRGGRAVFALDVTDPANVKLLWQKDQNAIAELGQVIGKPMIARMGSEDWRVVLGNGLNGSSDQARLLMLNLENGTDTVVSSGVSGGNGLSAVDAWDTNGDGDHDTAYGGDQAGNIWAFTGLDKNNPQKRLLFTAKDAAGNAQPVSAAPISAVDPKTRKRWVFFGTGRFLGSADLASKSVQSWYGIIDDGNAVSGRSQLVERKIKSDNLVAGRMVRVLESAIENDMTGKMGWFMDLKGSGSLLEGERMVVPSQLRGSSLVGTTRIPDSSDPCLPEGRGYIMAINPFTGARLGSGFFDVNGDGKIDKDDKVGSDDVSGLGFDSSPSAPIFIGNRMLSSLENASIGQATTGGGSGLIQRLSWREIVGD